MAHIKRMADKPRTLPWRAHINRKGLKPLVKMFKTRAEAEHWAQEQERSIRLTGLPLTIEDLKKHTVGDIVRRYLEEVTSSKGSCVSETTVLKKFLKHNICYKSLAYVSKQDAYKYRDDRLKDTWNGKPITSRTVRREVNSIQHVFEVAKDEWGFTNLVNPFRELKIKGSMHRRKRRLKDGELDRLGTAWDDCRGLNQYYVPLAIYLTIETGMRLQEMFNLTWDDVDIGKHRIEIRKSKTDHVSEYEGRTIVLPFVAEFLLMRLWVQFKAERFTSIVGKMNHHIFPMTKDAFKQSWADVKKRAGITDLTFHDLRREAGSRFDEAGLTKAEHDLMMGHTNKDMTSLYIHADLKSIQAKLDRYAPALRGKTREQVLEERKAGIGLWATDNR
jgi:integrase